MISSNEVIDLIKSFSLSERLMIAEEILRNIREENMAKKAEHRKEEASIEPAILNLAGIMDEEEAHLFTTAVEESRKIDANEW